MSHDHIITMEFFFSAKSQFCAFQNKECPPPTLIKFGGEIDKVIFIYVLIVTVAILARQRDLRIIRNLHLDWLSNYYVCR